MADPRNAVVVSAATAWEIATKHRLGKWPEVAGVIGAFETNVLRSRFGTLAITVEHARLAGLLEGPHRDPFDRMLIAQTRAEGVPIVSGDKVFQDYGATVVWDSA
jgi:PIN domain nuclease of toxin-antitoxin system